MFFFQSQAKNIATEWKSGWFWTKPGKYAMTRIHWWWELSSAIKWDRLQSFERWIRLKSSCQVFVLFCFYCPTLLSRSPWYNRNGWLGVKRQVTYSSHEAKLTVLHNTAKHTAIVSLHVNVCRNVLFPSALSLTCLPKMSVVCMSMNEMSFWWFCKYAYL